MISKDQEDIDEQLLIDICQLYDITVKDLNFIIAIDWNFVYEFTKENKEYILRGGTRHSPDQVQAELEWILFLNSSGVNVSVPILSNNEKYLEIVKHDGKNINAVVFERAPGKAVEWKNPEKWNELFWEQMGRTLGKMHAASFKYNSLQPEFRRVSAFESVHATAENHLDSVKDREIIEKFNNLKKKLNQLPKDKDAYGLIQYDFHLGNLNVHNEELIVYDFDDSYYFFFIHDIATCIHETVWYYPDDKKLEFVNRFIPSLWKGYSEEYKLDRKWLEYLPDFFKWREFGIYITLVETYNDKTTPEQHMQEVEEYMPDFRARVESDEQIVPIPENLEVWFKKH